MVTFSTQIIIKQSWSNKQNLKLKGDTPYKTSFISMLIENESKASMVRFIQSQNCDNEGHKSGFWGGEK